MPIEPPRVKLLHLATRSSRMTVVNGRIVYDGDQTESTRRSAVPLSQW